MTQEQVDNLLKPRYKVIADYPSSLYKIGSIFIKNGNHLFYNGVNHANFINPANYPHLFKSLAWYEDRDVKDLPMYLKSISTALSMKIGEVSKVKGYAKDIKKNGVFLEGKAFSRLIETLQPSTEQEYLTYINQSK